MHELSLCEDVVTLIEAQGREQGFARVATVWLEIGALAGVERQAMLASFDAVASGSIADGAKLCIIDIEGRADCPACHRQVDISTRFDACTECGHYPLRRRAGEEMRIRELEVQ